MPDVRIILDVAEVDPLELVCFIYFIVCRICVAPGCFQYLLDLGLVAPRRCYNNETFGADGGFIRIEFMALGNMSEDSVQRMVWIFSAEQTWVIFPGMRDFVSQRVLVRLPAYVWTALMLLLILTPRSFSALLKQRF